jgi:hypothetical protein
MSRDVGRQILLPTGVVDSPMRHFTSAYPRPSVRQLGQPIIIVEYKAGIVHGEMQNVT